MKFDLHIHTRRHSPDSVTDPFELLEAATAAGLDGIVITEHDYLWPELDGIEVTSSNMGTDLRARAADLLAKYPHFAQLGNSDSHAPDTVGVCYTEFDCAIRTAADLVAAIRGRKGTARVKG